MIWACQYSELGGANYTNDVLGLHSVTGFPFWESLCSISDFSAMWWDRARHLSDLLGQDGVFEELAGHKQGTPVWVTLDQFLQARHVKVTLRQCSNALSRQTLWESTPASQYCSFHVSRRNFSVGKKKKSKQNQNKPLKEYRAHN